MKGLKLAGAIACAASLCSATPALADSTVVVNENNVATTFSVFQRGAGSFDFTVGPAGQPLGLGSVVLHTPGLTAPVGNDKVSLLERQQAGASLASIDELGYSTNRRPESDTAEPRQVAALNMEVDVNGAAPGGFTTLVYEPVYNGQNTAVPEDVWQTWDAYDGGDAIWWSSNPIPSAPNRDTFVSWDTIVAANPGAVVLGYGPNQGGGNDRLHTAVDALKIGVAGDTTTYDFEPLVSPSSKEDCKNGGWQAYNNPVFKNQGDCVSSFAPGKNK